MSIQPIDLQTLFVRLSNIGKEQSAQRDAIVQNQAVTAGEIAQKAAQNAQTVHQPDEVSDGPETVTEDGSNRQRRDREKRKHSQPDGTEASADTFRDPTLGRHVDLSG